MEQRRAWGSLSNSTASQCDAFSKGYIQGQADVMNETAGDMNEQDGYNCPKCRNKGHIYFAESDGGGTYRLVSRSCECKKIRRSLRMLRENGLSHIIKSCTFDRYTASEPWQENIKAAAMAFAADPAGWFFVGGQSGSGKSHICCAICRDLLYAGKSFAYLAWRENAAELKRLVNDPQRYPEKMDRYKTAEVLYIDDLFKGGSERDGGKLQPSAADINLAFELFNSRYQNPQLITVISSEMQTGELLDVDEAVFGRVLERAGKYAINVARDRGRNYRLRGGVTV